MRLVGLHPALGVRARGVGCCVDRWALHAGSYLVHQDLPFSWEAFFLSAATTLRTQSRTKADLFSPAIEAEWARSRASLTVIRRTTYSDFGSGEDGLGIPRL